MPTTYTVKSLTEDEYQAMREAAAKAGKSMNKWLLEIIRANIQPTEEQTMYAIYQSGYNIYGVGNSEQAALADARQWIEGEANVEKPAGRIGGETIGNLYVRPCTSRLADAVRERGGDVAYETTDAGILDLAN